MLKPAAEYKDEIKGLLSSAAGRKNYHFFSCGYGHPAPEGVIKYEFVSVDKNNTILGYIDYWVNEAHNTATSFCAISFTDVVSPVFGGDIYRALDGAFCQLELNAIYFKTFAGHPIEKTYHTMARKYGGAFLGYEITPVILRDGNAYKVKKYKLTREGWLQHKQEKRAK